MKYAIWLWQNTRGIRLNTMVRIIAGIGQVGLGLLMVWLCKNFIDNTIHSSSTEDVMWMIGWLVLTVVGGIFLRQFYFYMTTKANIRQMNALRLSIYSRLFVRQLYTGQELHSGDVSSRLAKDIEVVSQASTEVLPQMMVTTIQLGGAFLLLRYFDERLAWALLVLTPLAIVFGKMIARKLRQMTLDIRKDESRINMHVQEVVEYNAVLRTMDSEQWLTGQLDTMQQRLRGHVMYRTRFTVITRIIMGLAFGLGYLLAFVWGGLQLRTGAITFGVMTSFLQLVAQIQHPILQLLNMVPTLIHATASVDRLTELDDNTMRKEEKEAELVKEVDFHDVSFRYQTGSREILSHFSHHFKAGSKTAIMGETGIGKTTMFRLMLRLIEPTEGVVTTGRGLCYVPQGNTLMSGTIRYNLQLAKPEVTDDELWKVLQVACAEFVKKLPEGLDTELGERGSGLSEGQAQRIAIARGLLCPGHVLLLDEISSALDEDTERELFSRLFSHYPDKTIILITHRSVVAALCDEKIVF